MSRCVAWFLWRSAFGRGNCLIETTEIDEGKANPEDVRTRDGSNGLIRTHRSKL